MTWSSLFFLPSRSSLLLCPHSNAAVLICCHVSGAEQAADSSPKCLLALTQASCSVPLSLSTSTGQHLPLQISIFPFDSLSAKWTVVLLAKTCIQWDHGVCICNSGDCVAGISCEMYLPSSPAAGVKRHVLSKWEDGHFHVSSYIWTAIIDGVIVIQARCFWKGL